MAATQRDARMVCWVDVLVMDAAAGEVHAHIECTCRGFELINQSYQQPIIPHGNTQFHSHKKHQVPHETKSTINQML
jgi:hypothetical protein